MDRLKGKVAIVTGAGKGIGAAIAKGLAAEGAAVVVNYSKSKGAAEATAKAITAAGGKAIAVGADVSKAGEVDRLFEAAKAAFGAPSVLVNNAAVGAFNSFEGYSEADYRAIFDANVLGTINTSKAAIREFPASGGSIVNISTISSQNPVPMTSFYSASKAAIDTLSLALAKELGGRNIRVNTVAPGYTDTDQTVMMRETDFGKGLISAVPLGGRLGRPEEIVPSVVFLASDESGWLTGERLHASGGVH
jgi:3-oxoacyl-[acyl-carrier protein] reductase